MVKLTVQTDETARLGVDAPEAVELNAETHIVVDTTAIYDGAYEWTPTDSVQLIDVENKKALGQIKINPIPQNYGLVTWNGSTLTIT